MICKPWTFLHCSSYIFYLSGECKIILSVIGLFNRYSTSGDPAGQDWVPAECDVSIRSGWFWHASEAPKSAITLLDLYYKSVGRNCLFLLNVPPNSSGLISPEDIQVLQEFSELRNAIFSHNLATNALVVASSTRAAGDSRFDPYNVLKEGLFTYWAPKKNQPDWSLYLDLQESVSFNVLQIQEPIHMGQRIAEFHLEILGDEDEKWKKVANGTTVGYQRLLRFPMVKSQFLRFVIVKSRADPLISYLGLYLDNFSILSHDLPDASRGRSSNSSQFIHHIVVNNSQLASM